MAKEREVASAERLAAEGGIASEENEVAESKIEANEGSEEEPEKEPGESVATQGDSGEAGCPIQMGVYLGAPRCRRRLHTTPSGVDAEPVCLMHSKDPNKQSGPLFDIFWLEFERILKSADKSEAHFEHFVFPQFDYLFQRRKFQAICRFAEAIFTQGADFLNATFSQEADFSKATFTQIADFSRATFIMRADFREAIFTQGANFYNAAFTEDAFFGRAILTMNAEFSNSTFLLGADFSHTTFAKDAVFCNVSFSRDADFSYVTFTQDADFHDAIFSQGANFWTATFVQDANLRGATFKQDAYFSFATFKRDTDFQGATFTRNAIFCSATFTRNADFRFATFKQTARFEDTKFHRTTYWQGCRFLDQAEFRHTKFDPRNPRMPSAVFAFAKFSKPGEIVFDDVDVSRALFHNCDVSQVSFTSSVTWGKRKGNRGLAVFEETISLEQEYGRELLRDGKRDYWAVAQIYQQLKKNYDSRLDYWTANEFHFGEMEMKRLAGPTDGRLLWLRRWWHRNLSLVAWYKYASDYGNSYGKPAVWLLVLILFLFPALLPLPGVGLKRQGDKPTETYASAWDSQKGYGEKLWAEARLFGKSVITSIDAATFQKNDEYAPAYPWGRVLSILETLLTSSLFALFLLAIRRQFRR
jgi:hypothetical protein